MSVHILYDADRDYAVLYCSTSMWAFGPIFSSDEDGDAQQRAEAFLEWLERLSNFGQYEQSLISAPRRDARLLTEARPECRLCGLARRCPPTRGAIVTVLVDQKVYALAEAFMSDYVAPPNNSPVDRASEIQELAEVIQVAIEEHLEWAVSQDRIKDHTRARSDEVSS